MSQKRIKLYVDSCVGNKLNSLTKYMKCDREELLKFLIVEAWKSIDAEKKDIKKELIVNKIDFNTPTFVTEGEI